MEQASPDQSDRFARCLLFAKHCPVLLEVTQLRELHVLKREIVRRQALCVHVDAGALYFRGLQQNSEVNGLPYEHGVLEPAVIWPYLQRLTGVRRNGLTLTWEQLAALAEREQHRITASGDLDRLDRNLSELWGPEAGKRPGTQEPVDPAAMAVGDRVITATAEPDKAQGIQGTLFDDLG